ncbi:YIP1 family protein [Alkalihalobacterium chitinilyticum]|uniref:YIP1 family protein n=1 Tax=Alkalihalobacterium chitinilyticum TaxID=2980103 RepID=A0ABT5VJT8_9BACI|nr:YIP1 family protein [Alkalihalobacterium chitinilyticum]MDE5415721.1 YIP1 family protein [Alkalihalobacterium chitinilyticum]
MSEVKVSSEENFKPEKPSLLGMVFSPGEQLERVKGNPKVLVPLLLVTLLYTIGAAITAFGMDSTWILQELGPDEAQFFAEIEGFMRVMILVTGLLVPLIGALIFAVVFLIVAKAAGKANVTFKKLYSLSLFVSVIGGLGFLFNGIMTTVFGANPNTPFTSLAVLMQAEGKLAIVLATIEVFTIWQIIVTVLGVRKVAEFNAGLAWASVIIYTVIGIFISLIGV